MKNKFLLAILAIALVFGMTVIGCSGKDSFGDDSGDNDTLINDDDGDPTIYITGIIIPITDQTYLVT